MTKRLLLLTFLCLVPAFASTVVVYQSIVGLDSQPIGGTVSVQITAACTNGSDYVGTGIVSKTFQPSGAAWAVSTGYSVGVQVSYLGVGYVAIAPSTGVTPGTDATKWVVGNFAMSIVPTEGCPVTGGTGSAWSGGTSYSVGDRVTYSGGVYLALLPSTGVVPPSSTTTWQIISPYYNVTFVLNSNQRINQKWAMGTVGPYHVSDIVIDQPPLIALPVPGPPGPGGGGSVTSVGLAGTANQITVTGASPITVAGAWTLSLPSSLALPGSLSASSGAIDFHLSTHTQPAKTGTVSALPGTCSTGEVYFATDATAGKNLYLCTGTNTWTQMSGGAVGSVFGRSGAVTAQSGDYSYSQISGTPLYPILPNLGGHASSAGSFTIPDTYYGFIVTATSSSPQLFTLPAAGTGAALAGWGVWIVSSGGLASKYVTVTAPGGEYISGIGGGSSSFVLYKGQSALVMCDGTGYTASWVESAPVSVTVPLKGDGNGGLLAASSSDIIGLFSACSGTQYLGADGTCHAGGTGTVTVVGAGALASGALMTGGGTTTSQTPNSSATLDGSGNFSTPGSGSFGVGSGTNAAIDIHAGTGAPTIAANSWRLTSPTTIATAFTWIGPGSAKTGIVRGDASGAVVTIDQSELSGAVTTSGSNATSLAVRYTTITCQPGFGDGTNAITAATYLMSECLNEFGGSVWTITAIKCYTDNTGSSTLAVSNGAGTSLLTGAITCSPSWAAGTQSATTTLAPGDYAKFTFIPDGTTKQATFVVTGIR